MRVTVVELPDDEELFDEAWPALLGHVAAAGSELVLLNEVPFAAWFGTTPLFDPAVWQRAVQRHIDAGVRLAELGTAALLTAPIGVEIRHNAGQLWTNGRPNRLRAKKLLPNEEPVWEAQWYSPGPDSPYLFEAANAKTALVICSELWELGWAADLGAAGAQLIATPRATASDSLTNWLAAGRVAAITSGAYSLSSNRVGNGFGGAGWVFAPDGELLAQTSTDEPFITVEIDLAAAEAARSTYPRYVIRPAP